MAKRVCEEVKLLAVRYYLKYKPNFVHAAKHFNTSPRTLERWVRKYRDQVISMYKL